MKILSNKKYYELLRKSMEGCFGNVNDDQLLREVGILHGENKELVEMLVELYKVLQRNKGMYCLKEFQKLDKWYNEKYKLWYVDD